MSGNQCAHPECTETLVKPTPGKSDDLFIGRICHIYPISLKGPRGKNEFPEKKLNAPENLILLCPNHHTIVDGQYKDYPVDMLKEWKQKHESEMEKRLSEDLASISPDLFSHPYFPQALVDQKIENDVDVLRKSRFFTEFNTVESSLTLARKIVEEELSGGTGKVRARALAWCARFLSSTEELNKAEEYLKIAKDLESSPETNIANAFISSYKGDKSAALGILAKIDLPAARSAALMIVTHHEGEEGAIEWLKTTGIKAMDLDPDGKYFILTLQFKLTRKEDALKTINAIDNQDLDEAPILHHMTAMAYLLSTVPKEFCADALSFDQLLFKAANFRLDSKAAGIDARRKALFHFTQAAQAAQKLNCPFAAMVEDEYALWLELRDLESSNNGRQKLEDGLNDLKSALRLVPLGFQFEVGLDIATVEQEIESQIALHGEITHSTAIARLAIAFEQDTPEAVANYITRYFDQFSKYFHKKSLQFLQIEKFFQAGLPKKAKKYLDLLLEEKLTETEEERLQRAITEAKGEDPIEPRKERFKETDSLLDLIDLVENLNLRQKWEGLCEYAEILFERTGDVHDADLLANALNKEKKTERLFLFLKANTDLFVQSKKLRILYCWSLYNEGTLLEARSELKKLGDDPEDPNYRILEVNIAIALGDWHSLFGFIANEYSKKDIRSARDLIGVASLAINLAAPQAKDLLFVAAQKSKDDAEVLAAAYFLASTAGWENDEEVTHWLQRAAELSGNDGPIHNIALKDILDQAPEWERQESEILPRLSCGEFPIFLAAQLLNKSLFDFTLFPALANQSKNDPRRRGGIPAYSGNKQPICFDTAGVVGIDVTALLTLSFLDLLDITLDTFNVVHIPHSTLIWLFEEKRKVAFHQPSLIKNAHQIRHLFATDQLEKFVPSTVADSNLSAQVGDDLAKLIAEAEKARDNDDAQSIVIRSSPVYQINSQMEEEADLTNHADVMSSCLSVIDKLRQKGNLTSIEEKRARDYLQLHEKPWPNQPKIEDGAILYLDHLSTIHFLHLGILEKLKPAGFRPIASPTDIARANELISYGNISNKVSEIMESIRAAVSSRIEIRKVTLGRQPNIDKPKEQLMPGHPSVDILALVRNCDVIITDDRFFNQNKTIKHDGEEASIFSTLDLLETLTLVGAITTDNRLEHRTHLRQSGYFFIPIDDEELTTHLTVSTAPDNEFSETAELKAIRENILHIRMNNWLQIPKEGTWLSGVLEVFVRVLKKLWLTDTDLPIVEGRSNWIADLIDSRSWVHRFKAEIGDEIVKTGRGADILKILSFPPEAPQDTKDAYWNWAENRILAPIKEQYPDLYTLIVDSQKRLIANITDLKLSDAGNDLEDSTHIRPVLAQMALEFIPPLMRSTLLEESDIQKEYGFKATSVITFDFGVAFQHHELLNSVREVLSNKGEAEVTDTAGRKWKLSKNTKTEKETTLVISHNNQHVTLPNFTVLSLDRKTRLCALNEIASDINLPISSKNTWHDVLSECSLGDENFHKFLNDLTDTPVSIAEFIRNEIANPQVNISRLIPNSRRYFERLVNAYDGSATIQDYATKKGRELFEQLSAWKPYDGFLFSLLLSSHSSLTVEISVNNLEREELVRAFEFLVKYGDRISQLGVIEVGFRILHERPEIEPFLIRLVKQVRDDDVDGKTSGFKSLSALFFFSYGELSRTRLLSSEPPFYRRLASLSHTALIHRQLINSRVDIDLFCKEAVNQRGGIYYLQSLTDMRLEPRWNPNLADATQMKANFFARIMAVAKDFEKNIKSSELRNLVLGTGPGSLRSLSEFPSLYYPGPLEGTEDRLNILPAEVSEAIKDQLSAKKITPLSFTALVNFAPFFHIDSEQAELAAKALKLGKYQLTGIKDKLQLLTILNGLATVAATVRSKALADELRILVRKYRHDTQYALSVEECLTIYLVAAASRADMNDWREYCGDCLTELAFGDLEDKDGKMLHSFIQHLCHAVPELWVSCGRAEAALMAFNSS